jgi:hypothetical protein
MRKPKEYCLIENKRDMNKKYWLRGEPTKKVADSFYYNVIDKFAYDKAVAALKGFHKYCIQPYCGCFACETLKDLGEIE